MYTTLLPLCRKTALGNLATFTVSSPALKEKSLKLRDFKFGKKAVKSYSFEIMKHGKFKISVHNYYDIIVKDSMLEVFPFPF